MSDDNVIGHYHIYFYWHEVEADYSNLTNDQLLTLLKLQVKCLRLFCNFEHEEVICIKFVTGVWQLIMALTEDKSSSSIYEIML